MTKDAATFRQRFLAGGPLTGSFLKIAHTMPAEILGTLGFDFVVIDEEHAPINRESTDRIILACKAAEMACLVRVRNAEPSEILSALDCGADGVLVPHVDSAAKAAAVVAAARYKSGSRGYAATTRAGEFGAKTMGDHMTNEDQRAVVIAMIEDTEAIEDIDAIVATEGLDAVFIGRADLAVAFGQTTAGTAPVIAATKAICSAANARNVTICAMVGSDKDIHMMADLGASAVIVASDQTFLRDAARERLFGIRLLLENRKT